MSRRFAFVVAIAFSALVVTSGSSAAPTDLFFSEYIEGSSNNKALEIYNGTGAAVDLAAGGYTSRCLQRQRHRRADDHAHGHRRRRRRVRRRPVLADPAILRPGRPDQRRRLVQRRRRHRPAQGHGAVIDSIGQVGVDPGTEWGTGLASTADNTLRRKATVVAGDTEPARRVRPVARMGRLRDRHFDGLGAHTVDGRRRRAGASRAPTRPTARPTSPSTANVTVTFSEPVTSRGMVHDLRARPAAPRGDRVSGGPTTFTLDPDGRLRRRRNVHASRSSRARSPTRTPTIRRTTWPADSTRRLHRRSTSARDPITPIPRSRAAALAAPMTGTRHDPGRRRRRLRGPSRRCRASTCRTRAGDGDSGDVGWHLRLHRQRPTRVAAGDVVRVTGFARERFNQTTLNGANSNTAAVPACNIVDCGTGTCRATEVTLPFADCDGSERFEGMLVRFPQALVDLRVLQLRPVRRDRAALPLDRRAAVRSRRPRSTSRAPPATPARSRTTCSRITARRRVRARRTRSACRHPERRAVHAGQHASAAATPSRT